MSSIDVFVSVGSNLSPEHENFISDIEQFLRTNGLNPRTVGRTDFSAIQPLKFIEQVMQDCAGTIVIAFERIYIEQGIEKRGSDAEKPLSNIKISTVWNQIEPGMAYVLGHPLLVIVEKDIRREGLLENGYDWYIQYVDISDSVVQQREFLGVFSDWKKRVEKYRVSGKKDMPNQPGSINPQELTVAQIIGSLKPVQLWISIGAIITALASIAGVSYRFGVSSSTPAQVNSTLNRTFNLGELVIDKQKYRQVDSGPGDGENHL